MEQTARSFQDLNVYQRLYKAMLVTMKEVVPKLPDEERFDLTSQMRRCCKSPLAIIAEGYARKNYRKDWLKYINEVMGRMQRNDCAPKLLSGSLLYKNSRRSNKQTD